MTTKKYTIEKLYIFYDVKYPEIHYSRRAVRDGEEITPETYEDEESELCYVETEWAVMENGKYICGCTMPSKAKLVRKAMEVLYNTTKTSKLSEELNLKRNYSE